MSLVVRAVYFDERGAVEVVFMDTGDVRGEGQLMLSQTLAIGSEPGPGRPDYSDEIATVVVAVQALLQDALEDFRAAPVAPAGMDRFGGG